MRRKSPRSPVGSLDNFLDALVEDVLGRTNEEVRAELREDGESLEDYSARARAAIRRAEYTLRSRRAAPVDLPISSGPIATGTAAGLPDVENIADSHGLALRGSRPVSRYSGDMESLLRFLPEFELAAFRSDAAMRPHPVLRLVLRKQRKELWSKRAVGAVSRSYALVQHGEAVELCLGAFERAGLDRSELQGELALSELGEWMDFSFSLPAAYGFQDTYGHDLDFRCGVTNSVDGSSPLKVRFNWFRQVCSNGMVVREKRRERMIHRTGIRETEWEKLDALERRIDKAFSAAAKDRETLASWQRSPVGPAALREWADDPLKRMWGPTRAGRVFSICGTGRDMEFDSWSRIIPSKLEGQSLGAVPGSPARATTIYDVVQALSWVASGQADIETRIERQAQIPKLLGLIQAH